MKPIKFGNRIIDLDRVQNPKLLRAISNRESDFMFRHKKYEDHTDHTEAPYSEAYSEYKEGPHHTDSKSPSYCDHSQHDDYYSCNDEGYTDHTDQHMDCGICTPRCSRC